MALCYVRLGADASDLVIQEYSLDDIIRKAVRKFAGQFIRRKIRVVYEGTDQKVITDEKWLSFIIEQLLSNAVKYTSEGNVTVEVHDGKKLSVTDTGIGIPKEHQERIFERFYRVDKSHSKERGGTGLGLSIVKHGAILHGAKVNVESEPGKGTRMEILFPQN